eukprot:8574013-Pyramimonas_sp.AAC.1
MRFSPKRRAHSFQTVQEFHGFPASTCQGLRCDRIQDYVGARVMLVCFVEVPGMVGWLDSGLSRRNSQVVPWRWNPENDVLACFRVFKRLSSEETVLSMEMNRCRSLWRGSSEG